MQEQNLVRLATQVCEACTSVRQERVKLVRITSWLTCPFKERVTTRVRPPPACYVADGPELCVQNTSPDNCPLLTGPLYRNGEIIMLAFIRYSTERR